MCVVRCRYGWRVQYSRAGRAVSYVSCRYGYNAASERWRRVAGAGTNLGGREGDKVRRAFEKSDVVCFAMDGARLVGAARALTDFEYHATIYDVVVTRGVPSLP